MNEFGKFIHSPFHNESEKMIKLYNFIKKYFPEFNDKNFTKENIYHELYGDGEYEDKKIRDRCSDMLKLAEEYLAILELKSDPYSFRKFSLDQFSQRRLQVHFDHKYNEIEKVLKTRNTTEDIEFFFQEFMLFSTTNAFYQHENSLGKRKNFFEDVGIEIEMFLRYFVMQMLKYYAFANHTKGLINVKFNYEFYEPVMEYLDKQNLDKYPLVKAFKILLSIHKNWNDENLYYQLKELYLNNYKSFKENDKIIIITELFNYAQIKNMAANPKFTNERFEIVKLQIEHEAYPKQNGWMQREQYIAVINVASNAREFKWMERFINEYTIKIVPEFREDTYYWGKSLLYYSQKKYDEALSDITKAKSIDYIYYLNIKTLLLKILFELQEFERILTVIDSFKHFLNSNSYIPPHLKNRNLNHLNFFHKITMLSMNNERDEFKILKLLKEIKNCPPQELSGLQWLLEKALNLKNNVRL